MVNDKIILISKRNKEDILMKLKKMLAIVLSMSLIFAGTANMAFADGGAAERENQDEGTITYELKVNGQQFSSGKNTIECGEGTAEYNHETATLTLKNADITEIVGYAGGCISSEIAELNIVLVGENTITNQYNTGIVSTGDLTISGEGTLKILCNMGISSGSYGNQSGMLTIKDTTVIMNTDDKCITANSDIIVENSTLEAKVNPGTYSYAMAITLGTTGNFVITNSDVDVESCDNAAISMGDVFSETERKLIINSGNVIIKSKGGSSEAISFSPVQNAFIEINGGLLNVESVVAVTNLEDAAIALNNVSIATGAWNEKSIKIAHPNHQYGTEWMHDKDNHWHECECGAKTDITAHIGGTATENEQAVCEICNTPYGEKVTKPVETTEAPNTTTSSQVEITTVGQEVTTTVDVSEKKINVPKTKCKMATKSYKSVKIKISLKKVMKANKYQIQIAKSKRFNKVLIKKTVKKAKITLSNKKLKNKKNLFVRARVIQIIDKKLYTSKWSKVKKVKIKK